MSTGSSNFQTVLKKGANHLKSNLKKEPNFCPSTGDAIIAQLLQLFDISVSPI